MKNKKVKKQKNKGNIEADNGTFISYKSRDEFTNKTLKYGYEQDSCDL